MPVNWIRHFTPKNPIKPADVGPRTYMERLAVAEGEILLLRRQLNILIDTIAKMESRK